MRVFPFPSGVKWGAALMLGACAQVDPEPPAAPAPAEMASVAQALAPFGNLYPGYTSVDSILGWACDPDVPNNPILVRLSYGGPLDGTRPTQDVVANEPGESGIGQVCGGSSAHRFNALPSGVALRKLGPGTFSVYAYALDSVSLAPTPLQTSPQPLTVPSTLPAIGILDVPTHQRVTGWACDPDTPGTSVSVSITYGAPLGGTPLARQDIVANLGSEQAVNDLCKGGTAHRFSVAPPATVVNPLRAGQAVPVYAVGYDTSTGAARALDLSGRQLVDQAPIGWLEPPDSSGRLKGWACDPDTPNDSISVHLYIGAPGGACTRQFVGVTANLPSEQAVNDLCKGGTAHRFDYTLLPDVKDKLGDGSYAVYAYGIDTLGGPNAQLQGAGRQMVLGSPAFQVDVLEYMLNYNGYPTRWASDGSYDFVTFESTGSPETGAPFYYVRTSADVPTGGSQYERFALSGDDIVLERSTDRNLTDGRGNDAFDALPYGSLREARRYWTLGQELVSTTTLAGFNHHHFEDGAQCHPSWEKPYGSSTTVRKVLKYHLRDKDWGNGLRAESIAIESDDGQEVRWYGRGHGLLAREWCGPPRPDKKTVVWNRLDTQRPVPRYIYCDELDTRGARFLETSTFHSNLHYLWDDCRGLGTCSDTELLVGLSRAGNTGRTALCRHIDERLEPTTGGYVRLTTDANEDQRRAWRTVNGNSDWDVGYLKLECGGNEAVHAVSQNLLQCQGNNRFHAVLCAQDFRHSLDTVCEVRRLGGGDDRATWLNNHDGSGGYYWTGDWDPGATKAECGRRQYVAGVSVEFGTGAPHAILCCNYSTF